MLDLTHFDLLKNIASPADLRKLSKDKLPILAAELRQFMLLALNECGGHFAGNLGTVELTIALHYVFNTPDDRVVWDVGHQAYPHKILTGRRDRLVTLRQQGGLAPFLSRCESCYDSFGAGHSSTSISAALGMAVAAQQQGLKRKVVAIIGDGAMTAGMAFEALNHAGAMKANLLVVLNDNDMSISENVGALSNYFANIMASKLYTGFRRGSKKILKRVPPIGEFARRTEEYLKGMLVPGALFEELGFNYLGPFDGHDLKNLVQNFENIRELSGPQLMHVITKKGKGYAPAEAEPILYHAVKANYLRSTTIPAAPVKPSYADVFGAWICDMAALEPRLVAITPAMREGSNLIAFSQHYPQRYFDVGIAEQHSVTLAAGMACDGLKPVLAIYSTFLQRAYDQFIHDVALQKLPVLFAIDRAGLVGGDGSTHNGCYDMAYLRCIPNIVLMAPADENELRQMLYTGMLLDSPAAVRYPRGTGPGVAVTNTMAALPIGKAQLCRQGQNVAILAFGSMLKPSLLAAAALNATVINMRFVKPLDEALLTQLAAQYKLLVTVEEGIIAGGAGSAVSEFLVKASLPCPILHLGIPDRPIEHGEVSDLLADLGLDAAGIQRSIEKRYPSSNTVAAPN